MSHSVSSSFPSSSATFFEKKSFVNGLNLVWAFSSAGKVVEIVHGDIIKYGQKEESSFLERFKLNPLDEQVRLCALASSALRGSRLCHLAASLGCNQFLRYIFTLPSADINVTDDLGNTPLHHCALACNEIGIKILLDLGAENKKNAYGASASDLWHMVSGDGFLSLATGICSVLEKETDASFVIAHQRSPEMITFMTPDKQKISMNARDFARMRGESDFLISHHLSRPLEVFPLYMKPLIKQGARQIRLREKILEKPLRDFYVESLPGTGHVLKANRFFLEGEPIVQWFGEFYIDLKHHFISSGIADTEHSVFSYDNERMKTPACLMEDGFPNIVYELIRGVSGLREELFFIAGTDSAIDTIFCWDYGSEHRVKYGPHIERHWEVVQTFIRDQETVGRAKTVDQTLYLHYSFLNALAIRKACLEDVSSDYLASRLVIDRYRYLLSTPACQLLIIASSITNRSGFLNLIKVMPELLEEEIARHPSFGALYDLFIKAMSTWALLLDNMEKKGLIIPGSALKEALVVTQSYTLENVLSWLELQNKSLSEQQG